MEAANKSNAPVPVPYGTADPIQFLIENGSSILEIAATWGFRTTDSVYKLKRYDYTPPPLTAQRMAETFGWTAGEVIDHWLKRTQEKSLAAKGGTE